MATYTEHLDLNGLDEEDELTDDEVFTRGGKSIPLDENGISKPLMAPRHRVSKTDVLHTRVRKVPPLRVIWGPIIYGLIALGAVIGIICLVVFLINTFMAHLSTSHQLLHTHTRKAILPCTNITVSDIWVQTFPMLTTETAVRLDDINLDGAEDIIMGFGTGADAFYYPRVVCDVYFDGQEFCGGGILALNGRTGQEIWRRYTPHEIFAINCNADLDGDKIKDCIGGGRMAGLLAVSGKDGTVIWDFKNSDAIMKTSNMYTPVYINDINSDGVPDLVQIHGGDPLKEPGSPTRLVGRLLVISGRNGQVVQWVEVPDKKESYYSPQILTRPDGSQMVLFGTGGETHGGSLWYISLVDLLNGHVEKADKIYTDKYKGIMTPPVLIDITKDGVLDVVMAMFNSSVIAFDGLTFKTIWISHFPSSESYSTPGVGYFNDDAVPDFIVNYQTGPGFPVYYYTQTTILDGRTGQHLLSEPIKMVVGTQSSPLVISAEGFGNDIFLYWVSDCHGVSGEDRNLKFSFVHGTTIHEQSRADFCKLRFKERLFTRMYALNHASGPPGTIVYDSDLRQEVEHRDTLNYTEIGLRFLEKHPNYWSDYYNYPSQGRKKWTDEDHRVLDGPPEMDVRLPAGRYQEKTHYKAYPWPHDRPENHRHSSVSMGDSHDDQYPSYYTFRKNIHHIDPSGTQVRYNYPYNERVSSSSGDSDGYHKSNRWQEPDLYGQDWHDWQDWYGEPEEWYAEKPKTPTYQPYLQNRHRLPYDRRYLHRRRANEVTDHSGFRKKLARSRRKVLEKRHVGPHDGGGIQRTISTGTLVKPLSEDGEINYSMDIVFATFWFYPAKTQALVPEDQECIKDRLAGEAERFQPESKYYGLDHDAYEEAVTSECLQKSGHDARYEEGTYVNVDEYNPFNRPMGQMTLYRLKISCHCDAVDLPDGQECTNILPFHQQGWSGYMGPKGDGVFVSRPSS